MTEQCGDVQTFTRRIALGTVPVKAKCIKDEGHDGRHTNGEYSWK